MQDFSFFVSNITCGSHSLIFIFRTYGLIVEVVDMKYADALRQALTNPEFVLRYHAFRKSVESEHIAGSIQFSIGDDAFYFSGECVYNSETDSYESIYKGGKHNPKRSLYLIRCGYTFVV